MSRRNNISPSSYAHWRATDLGAITERLEHDLILSMMPPLEGLKVLDVGCGDGALTEKLAERGADVIGVDANPDMIAVAKERKGGAYQVGDAAALPFADDTFDVVTAMTVLCLCANPDKLVGEMARVLKPGGHLVIGELGKWSLWALIRKLRGLMGKSLWWNTRFFSKAALADLASGNSLCIQEVRGSIYYPPFDPIAQVMRPLDPIVSRLCGQVGAAFLVLHAESRQTCEEHPQSALLTHFVTK